MLRGLYTAAASMKSAEFKMDTLANNLANVNTVGFKKNGINFQSFPEMLLQKIDQNGAKDIGTIASGNKVKNTAIDFNQGSLRQTGSTFDLAIQGDGFFTVMDPNTEKMYYTRNGEFIIDNQGYLTTLDGKWVMSQRATEQESPILLPPGAKEVQITNAGTVAVDGNSIASIKIATFEDNRTLEKFQDNLFTGSEATVEKEHLYADEGSEYQIFQGTLELSNVNVVSEMVSNITGMRLYESLQKNIQMQNSTLEKAVNEVGQYR